MDDILEKFKEYERLFWKYYYVYDHMRVIIARTNYETCINLYDYQIKRNDDESIKIDDVIDKLKSGELQDWTALDKKLSIPKFKDRINELELEYKKKLPNIYKQKVRFVLIHDNQWNSDSIEDYAKISVDGLLKHLLYEARNITSERGAWESIEKSYQDEIRKLKQEKIKKSKIYSCIYYNFIFIVINYLLTMRSLLNKNFIKDFMIKRKKYIQSRNNSIPIVY